MSALPTTRAQHGLDVASLANRVARLLQADRLVTIKIYSGGKISQTSNLEEETVTGNNVFAGYLMYESSPHSYTVPNFLNEYKSRPTHPVHIPSHCQCCESPRLEQGFDSVSPLVE